MKRVVAGMQVSEDAYETIALDDSNEIWELVRGRLRKRPGMTTEHEEVGRRLVRRLNLQLSEDEFTVDKSGARLRISNGSFYVPDVAVIPRSFERRARTERPRRLEVFDDPLPLVVEVWSPSTGVYDVEEKLREYQLRGDLEIWRIHPYQRTLTVWRKQPDQTYVERVYTSGVVQLVALPAAIVLDELFD